MGIVWLRRVLRTEGMWQSSWHKVGLVMGSSPYWRLPVLPYIPAQTCSLCPAIAHGSGWNSWGCRLPSTACFLEVLARAQLVCTPGFTFMPAQCLCGRLCGIQPRSSFRPEDCLPGRAISSPYSPQHPNPLARPLLSPVALVTLPHLLLASPLPALTVSL